MIRIAILCAVLALAGCGSRGTLTQAEGQPLPPTPIFAATPPTPEEMLTAPPETAPDRVDDLISRPDRERPADPFDLPPTA